MVPYREKTVLFRPIDTQTVWHVRHANSRIYNAIKDSWMRIELKAKLKRFRKSTKNGHWWNFFAFCIVYLCHHIKHIHTHTKTFSHRASQISLNRLFTTSILKLQRCLSIHNANHLFLQVFSLCVWPRISDLWNHFGILFFTTRKQTSQLVSFVLCAPNGKWHNLI